MAEEQQQQQRGSAGTIDSHALLSLADEIKQLVHLCAAPLAPESTDASSTAAGEGGATAAAAALADPRTTRLEIGKRATALRNRLAAVRNAVASERHTLQLDMSVDELAREIDEHERALSDEVKVAKDLADRLEGAGKANWTGLRDTLEGT